MISAGIKLIFRTCHRPTNTFDSNDYSKTSMPFVLSICVPLANVSQLVNIEECPETMEFYLMWGNVLCFNSTFLILNNFIIIERTHIFPVVYFIFQSVCLLSMRHFVRLMHSYSMMDGCITRCMYVCIFNILGRHIHTFICVYERIERLAFWYIFFYFVWL